MAKRVCDIKNAEVTLRFGNRNGKIGMYPVLIGYLNDPERGFVDSRQMWTSPIVSISYEDEAYDAIVETDNTVYRVTWA